MRKPRLLWQVFLVQLAILVILILGLEWYAASWARQFYKRSKQDELQAVAQASEAQIRELMSQTDRLAEIQNTLRQGTPVILSNMEVVTT